MNSAEDFKFYSTLDAADYYSNERFALEARRIFYKEWIYVLHESQLPEAGSYQTFEIIDKPIVVVRGKDGSIRGFYNVCVHRGHILAKGCGKTAQFVCPYHSWVYDSHDGRLRRARGISDIETLPESNRGLVPIELDSIDGFVFARLEGRGGKSLHEMFKPFFEELRQRQPDLPKLKFAKRFVAEVDGNWKIMVENYLECYHCVPTHPALADLMRIDKFQIAQSPYHLTTRAPSGRPDNTAFKYTVTEASHQDFFGWWTWPNTTFNIFPGQANLLVFHMLPVSAEKSVGYCDYFFVDGKVDEEAQALMDWEGNVLEHEDNMLIVSAHRGMKSGALKRGVFLVHPQRHDFTESPLVHFNDLISRAIGADALHCVGASDRPRPPAAT